MTESGHISAVISLTDQLSELVEQETALLRERKTGEIGALLEQKSALAAQYAREMNTLRRNRSVIEVAAPHLISRLKSATRRFQNLLEEHRRWLNAALHLTEGVVKSISEEVARKNQPVAAYGDNARVNRVGAPAPTSIALNQTI